jgi:hypothetical protein
MPLASFLQGVIGAGPAGEKANFKDCEKYHETWP